MVPREDDIKVTFIAANTFGINTPMNKEINWCVLHESLMSREYVCVLWMIGSPYSGLISPFIDALRVVIPMYLLFAMIFSCWLPWILGFPSAFRPSDGHPLISSLAILSPFQLAAMFRPCCPSISGRSFSYAFHGSSTWPYTSMHIWNSTLATHGEF